MAYMRGENYIWADDYAVHFWIADGQDYWEESSDWGRDDEGNHLYRNEYGDVTASGLRIEHSVLDQFVVMRFAELLEEGRFAEAARNALEYDPDSPRAPLIRKLMESLEAADEMNPDITIRPEQETDSDAVTRLTEAAFRNAPHSSHTEPFIVNALRRHGQLTVSLVATENGVVIGHVAVSPVTISSGAAGWYGLGPISVAPDRQGRGIGSRLMIEALAELRRLGGRGCVVLGDPAYYGRFGFRTRLGLHLPGVPPEYFQALSLSGEPPTGTVRYHEAFDATK